MIEDNSLGLEFKYLIVNDMDRKFGLWVNTVGYQSSPPPSVQIHIFPDLSSAIAPTTGKDNPVSEA
mgnify:CR=1 FL=1